MAFSPNGKMLATAEREKIQLWDAAASQGKSGKMLRLIATRGDVRALAFSPNGKLLAAASGEKRLSLFEADTGKEIASFAGHMKDVVGLAFSPDSKTLASASDDGTAYLWDVATRKLAGILKGHGSPVASVAFAPDGKTLATAGKLDKTLRLWDRQTGKELAVFKEHTKSLAAVVFSSDGKRIVTAGDDAIRIWSAGDRPGPKVAPHQDGLAERLAALPTGLINSKRGDSDVVEALYLAAFKRLVTDAERDQATKQLSKTKNREEASRDLLWALVNSPEFRRLQFGDDVAAAREFTAKINKAWDRK